MFEAVVIVFNVVILIACAVLAVSNAKLWVELLAMKSSTHTLTYVDPLQQAFSGKPNAKDDAKASADPLGNIAISDIGDDL